MFYQGRKIDHFTYVTGSVSQSIAENEYSSVCTAVMDLAHLRMLNNKLPRKDKYVVPEKAPIIILDGKLDICMADNGNETKQNRHISRRMNFVRNDEEYNFHKKVWYEGGLKLADIGPNNAREVN